MRQKLGAVALAALMALVLTDGGHAQVARENMALRAGDILRITVWPSADLGGEYPIEDTGLVHLPLLGSVTAAGVPLGELRRDLRAKYAAAIQNPIVSITPIFGVGVLGAVARPGVYQVTTTQTFMDVVAQAGGFGPAADPGKIRIIRNNQIVPVDAARFLTEGLGVTDISLQSGDQIVIPATTGINWRTIFEIVRTISTIALLADRLSG